MGRLTSSIGQMTLTAEWSSYNRNETHEGNTVVKFSATLECPRERKENPLIKAHRLLITPIVSQEPNFDGGDWWPLTQKVTFIRSASLLVLTISYSIHILNAHSCWGIVSTRIKRLRYSEVGFQSKKYRHPSLSFQLPTTFAKALQSENVFTPPKIRITRHGVSSSQTK